MFQKVLTCALLAGFSAGLIAALLHLGFIQPVLLQAELYESGTLVHLTANTPGQLPDVPMFNLMRDALSALFYALLYVGYALILVACMGLAAEHGHVITARTGLIWGLAGFIAVQAAPSFSLPPEVPGVATADIGARQLWWWGTAAATAIALGLIAFGPLPAAWASLILLLAPHLIGAPHPGGYTGLAPPELAALFTARTLGVGLAVWALLGMFAGYFWQRETVEV